MPAVGAVDARGGTPALRRRDGHRVEPAVTVRPVLAPRGTPAGYLVTADPPCPPPAALAAHAFRQAPMSVAVFDLDRRYLRVNDAVGRLMGVSADALPGRFFPETVEDTEHSRGFLQHLRQVARTGRPVRYDSCTGAPALNRQHAWSIEMRPLADDSGEPAGVALAAVDSGDQYRARRRLAQLQRGARVAPAAPPGPSRGAGRAACALLRARGAARYGHQAPEDRRRLRAGAGGAERDEVREPAGSPGPARP